MAIQLLGDARHAAELKDLADVHFGHREGSDARSIAHEAFATQARNAADRSRELQGS